MSQIDYCDQVNLDYVIREYKRSGSTKELEDLISNQSVRIKDLEIAVEQLDDELDMIERSEQTDMQELEYDNHELESENFILENRNEELQDEISDLHNTNEELEEELEKKIKLLERKLSVTKGD